MGLICAALRKRLSQGQNRQASSVALLRYDFRRGLDEQGEWFANFTQLVIDTYELNNQTKVVLVTHSMGGTQLRFSPGSKALQRASHLGPFALYWLHQQSAAFKAKYIRSMINIAAPWGGAIKALRLMISGDNIDVSYR